MQEKYYDKKNKRKKFCIYIICYSNMECKISNYIPVIILKMLLMHNY